MIWSHPFIPAFFIWGDWGPETAGPLSMLFLLKKHDWPISDPPSTFYHLSHLLSKQMSRTFWPLEFPSKGAWKAVPQSVGPCQGIAAPPTGRVVASALKNPDYPEVWQESGYLPLNFIVSFISKYTPTLCSLVLIPHLAAVWVTHTHTIFHQIFHLVSHVDLLQHGTWDKDSGAHDVSLREQGQGK
jgi:hypothetical protein